MKAYHFCVGTTDRTVRRDGIVLEPGGTEVHEGPVMICASGLHASRHVADALAYAPGPILRLVEIVGEVEEEDKLCGRTRQEITRIDVTRLLQEYAVDCAERVWHLVAQEGQLAAAWAIDATRRGADPEEMEAASDAAWAARDAARAASDAIRAAGYAAWTAERAWQRVHLQSLVDTAFAKEVVP